MQALYQLSVGDRSPVPHIAVHVVRYVDAFPVIVQCFEVRLHVTSAM